LPKKKNVSPKQELKVFFQQNVTLETINEYNVFVLDKDGNDVEVVVKPILKTVMSKVYQLNRKKSVRL
jgi:hypothetical protein